MSKCSFQAHSILGHLLVSEVRVPSTVALVHDFQVLVGQLARVAEHCIGSRHGALLFTFALVGGDLCSLTVWELAVVVPPVNVTTDPSLLASVSSVQNVDLSTSFLAGEKALLSLACLQCVVLSHWAERGVAVLFVSGMSERRAWFTAVFRRSACSCTCLGTTTAGERAGAPFGPCRVFSVNGTVFGVACLDFLVASGARVSVVHRFGGATVSECRLVSATASLAARSE